MEITITYFNRNNNVNTIFNNRVFNLKRKNYNNKRKKKVKIMRILKDRDYIYRERENGEILVKSKPRELSRFEIVMKWEIIRRIKKGKRRLKRRIARLYKRNEEIMGLYYEEKGVITRKSRKRVKGLGRKSESSKDSRIEYRE